MGFVMGMVTNGLTAIDDLSLETMRRLLGGAGEDLATSRNLADLTTSSVPALRAYLEGERHYRQAEFPRAVEAYERALEADSAFALALFRISDAYGWLESVISETAIEWGARSVQHMDRLSPRNRVIVAAGNALYQNDLTWVAEDLGSQTGPLMSLELYRRFLLPGQIIMADLARSFGIHIMYHTDGAARIFLPGGHANLSLGGLARK